MNTARKMSYENSYNEPAETRLYVVSSHDANDDKISVDGKLMSKYELNEKLAYFYEHGGPVMDI